MLICFFILFLDFTEQLANLSLSMIDGRLSALDDIMYQAGNLTETFNDDAMNLSSIHQNIGMCWIFLLSICYMYVLWLNTCAMINFWTSPVLSKGVEPAVLVID